MDLDIFEKQGLPYGITLRASFNGGSASKQRNANFHLDPPQAAPIVPSQTPSDTPSSVHVSRTMSTPHPAQNGITDMTLNGITSKLYSIHGNGNVLMVSDRNRHRAVTNLQDPPVGFTRMGMGLASLVSLGPIGCSTATQLQRPQITTCPGPPLGPATHKPVQRNKMPNPSVKSSSN